MTAYLIFILFSHDLIRPAFDIPDIRYPIFVELRLM